MRIVMIGTGYVGLVTGTCFADSGNDVVCVDIDQKKVERLQKGDIPIYEPGLSEMVTRNVAAGRLKFTTQVAECVPTANCVFLAVGTPQGEDGSADLKYLFSAVDSIAPHSSSGTVTKWYGDGPRQNQISPLNSSSIPRA